MRAYGLGVPKSESKSATEDEAKNRDLIPLHNEITVTIVCITRPDKILNDLKKELRFVKKAPGIYHCDEVLGKWIIHPSELSLIPKNYPLLPLARGDKLEQFLVCARGFERLSATDYIVFQKNLWC